MHNNYYQRTVVSFNNLGNSSVVLVLDLITTVAAVVSSIAALLVSSIFFFCVGCICGRRQRKLIKGEGISDKKIACTQQSQVQPHPIPVPVYEELQSTSNQVKSFELIGNVAYDP